MEPIVKLENTVDWRTQKLTKNPERARQMREKRNMLKAKGICVICEKEPVSNRTTCFDCGQRTQWYNERRIIKKYGFPMPHELMTNEERAMAGQLVVVV